MKQSLLTYLFLLLLLFAAGLVRAQNRFQGFEQTAADNWPLTATPLAYNVSAGGADDYWTDTTATAQISPATGNRFWYMLDLENPNGGGAFFHHLDFETVDVSAFSSNTITFKYYTIGYEAVDSIGYVLETDNGSGFNFSNYVDLNRNTMAWTTVTVNLPAGTQFVRLRLSAKQNGGSDYAGFDDIQLISANGDMIAPTVVNATVTSANTIQLVFTEALNATAENTANYTGVPDLATATRNASGDTITLSFNTAFVNGQPYALQVAGVEDAAGNALAAPYDFAFVFNNSTPKLVITEINYNPPSNDPDILEFIEIYNHDTQPAVIGGLQVSGVVGMTLPNLTLDPGGIVLIAQNKIACDTFFLGQTFYQWNTGSVLTNGGNTIVISNSEGVEIDRVVYDDVAPWPLEPDGQGPSLELLAPNFDNNDGANWKAASTQVDTFNVYANPGIVNIPSLAVIGFDKANTRVSESNDTVKIAVKVANQELPIAEARLVAVSASTAVAGEDYVLLDTLVTFPLGATTPILVNLALIDDSTPRDSRYLILQLTDYVAAEGGSITEHAVLISDNDTPAPAPQPANLVQLEYLSSYSVDTLPASAEISAYDPVSKRLFVTDILQNILEVIDLKNPTALKTVQRIDLSQYAAGVNHVAVLNGLVAVAVEDDTLQNPGKVLFFDANGTFLNSVTVGSLPDMVTFTPDGTKVLTANEGEPSTDYSVDPEGTVSIIDMTPGVAALTDANVSTIGFSAFNADSAALVAAGLRIYGPGSSLSQDVEPEYITVSADGKTAYVTLQEANGLGIIDLDTRTVTGIKPLGTKPWHQSSLDVADNLGSIFFNNWNVRGMYQPDGIAHFSVAGENYLVTANEGDAREYDAITELVRLSSSSYKLDSTAFPDAKYLKRSDLLGRLNVTLASGDTDGDGDYDEIHTLGGRSFSIWNATTGGLVWDSGDDFERITAADPVFGSLFNVSNSNNTYKNRSDDKGPEPEGVALAEIEGRQYAFVALERIGGVMLYEISDPAAPEFIQYINTRTLGAVGGDLGPEGILFIPKNESPNGRNLLVVSNEVSGSLLVFQINLDKTQTEYSLTKYSFDNTPLIGVTADSLSIYEGGVSGLHYRDGEFRFISDRGPNADALNHPNANGQTVLVFPFPGYTPKVWSVEPHPDGTLQVNNTYNLLRPDGSGMSGIPLPVGFGNTGEVAWSDTSGTVVPNDAWGIDSEGLTQDNEGNWWVCDEYGTSIYQLDHNYQVKRRFTPFPGQPEDVQLDTLLGKRRANRGLEGIAYTPNGKIYAIIQSPINNPTVTVGNNSQIHRLVELDPATGGMRTFVYVHDAPLGEIRSRDWKIGDLAAINNEEFLVLEHAERNGWNAKNIYKFSIAGATPVSGNSFNGNTLEQLNNAAGLATNGIVPVTKTLYADLLELGWERQHDKPEGLVVMNDSTFAVVNDNDFGISSPLGDGQIVSTGRTTRLYVYTVPTVKSLDYVSPYCKVDLGQDFLTCGAVETALEVSTQGFSQALWSDGSTENFLIINAPGTYSVTATNEYGCVSKDTILIEAAPFPDVNLGENLFICEGESLQNTLDAGNPGATYVWNTGDSTQTISVNATGSYAVTVTSGAGCESSDVIFIAQVPNPFINLGADTGFCPGGNLTLDAQNLGSQYFWNTGDTTQTLTIDEAGEYIVTVTNIFGCTSSDGIQVDAYLPSIGTLNVSACVNASYIYQGVAIPAGSAQTFTLINAFGCDSLLTVNVAANPLPVVNLGPDTTLCVGQTLTLDAGTDGVAYQWNSGPVSQTITVSNANTFAVTVTNSFGCRASDQIAVAVEVCSDVTEPALSQVVVYPNPSSGYFTIQLNALPQEPVVLSVFNSVGQQVVSAQQLTDLTNPADLSSLPKGMYWLKIQSGASMKAVQVVIQ